MRNRERERMSEKRGRRGTGGERTGRRRREEVDEGNRKKTEEPEEIGSKTYLVDNETTCRSGEDHFII